MRINKYLAGSGVASRREADTLILSGKVTVNGKSAQPGMQVEDTDEVCVSGKRIFYLPEKTYLLFNKPVGLVCTSSEKEKMNIFSYLKWPGYITYAGRLDKDSEGLLLLTDDGDLIDSLMKGSAGHEKEYVVRTARPVKIEVLRKMEKGVYLEDLNRMTKPCRIRKSGENEFHITLTEGINRQIRRMCRAMNMQIVSLKRIRIENLLMGELKTGEYRRLTSSEVKGLLQAVCRDNS